MWAALIPAAISLFTTLYGSKKASDANKAALAQAQPAQQAQASLIRQQQQQMTEADPVRQALVQLAYKNLPVYARQGIAPPSFGGQTPTYFGGGRANSGQGSDGRAVRREAY